MIIPAYIRSSGALVTLIPSDAGVMRLRLPASAKKSQASRMETGRFWRASRRCSFIGHGARVLAAAEANRAPGPRTTGRGPNGAALARRRRGRQRVAHVEHTRGAMARQTLLVGMAHPDD